MKKKWFVVLILFVITSSLYASDDISLYINGLESIIQEKDEDAIDSFEQLVNLYPSSEYQFKANDYLLSLKNDKDNSGIVSFYLNNIYTLTYTAFGLADFLEISDDSLVLGLTGFAGVGAGIGVSLQLSKDYEITKELNMRMSTNQTVAMGNMLYLTEILYGEDVIGYGRFDDKIVRASQLVAINSSLYLSYFGLRDKELEEGKGFFGFQSYIWSNYYYWLTTLMLQNEFTTTDLLLGMAISDAAYLGAQPLWDNIKWSDTRSGLVSVGGLGGALLGIFSNFVLEEFIDLGVQATTGIIMGTTLAGQIYATYLTRNIDNNKQFKVASHNPIMPYPIIKSNNEVGIGFNMYI